LQHNETNTYKPNTTIHRKEPFSSVSSSSSSSRHPKIRSIDFYGDDSTHVVLEQLVMMMMIPFPVADDNTCYGVPRQMMTTRIL
jgi:hypothetical protein